MRATTVFNKILAPLGVIVRDVTFEKGDLVLLARASGRRLRCACGFTTVSAYDKSVRRWRHLDVMGTTVFIQAEIRRLYCADCGRVVTEEVAWARHGARQTLQFENVVAWWCQR